MPLEDQLIDRSRLFQRLHHKRHQLYWRAAVSQRDVHLGNVSLSTNRRPGNEAVAKRTDQWESRKEQPCTEGAEAESPAVPCVSFLLIICTASPPSSSRWTLPAWWRSTSPVTRWRGRALVRSTLCTGSARASDFPTIQPCCEGFVEVKHSGASSSSIHGSPAAVTLAPTNGGESNHYSQTRKNLLANTSHATTPCCNDARYISKLRVTLTFSL